MTGFPNEKELARIRKQYPPGTRVRLLKMADDPFPPPDGCEGEVTMVDDAGHVHTKWDNGSGLSFIPGIDEVAIVR